MARLPSASAFDADAARQMLEWLDQIQLVSIHRSGVGHLVNARYFGTDIEAAIDWAMSENREQRGVYWTINRVRNGFARKPGEGDMESYRFVHVDLDPPKSGDAFNYTATMETLETMRCPPSFVISSGGGLQALWRIEDSQNAEAIKSINFQVRDMFCADACQNLDRLFRLAGTINYPNAAKEARGRKAAMCSILSPDNGCIYYPDELAAFFPPAEHGTASDVERAKVALGNITLTDADTLGLTPFHKLRVALERPKGSDRSANALHAACEAVREGLPDDTIAGLLLNPANTVSAHILDQGDPLRAARRTIGQARGEEPDTLVVAEEVRVAPIVVKPKGIDTIETPVRDEKPEWYAGLTDGLRMMVDTVNTYSPNPRPELALGSAISAFATAMGRRYQTPSGLLSNIYLVGLTPSGGGKDLPVNAPAQALMLCGETGVKMVGGDIVSARGIMSAIEASPTLFIPADEVGKLIQAIQDPRGNLKDAVTVLLKMYSASQSVFKGAMYANTKDRPTMLIYRPCLSFYGVSNPGSFWEKLTHSSISEGLLPRFILLPDNMPDEAPPRRLKRCVYPDALIESLRACMAGAEGHMTFAMGDGASTQNNPYMLEYADSAADDREYQMRIDQYEWAKNVEPEMTPFVKRAAENGQKLALVRAVSDNPAKPVMRAEDLEWGWQISKRSVEEFMTQSAGNISENEIEAKLKKMLAWIGGRENGATTSECGRKFQSIPARERDDILGDMEAQGLITKERVEGAGRPVHRYRVLPAS